MCCCATNLRLQREKSDPARLNVTKAAGTVFSRAFCCSSKMRRLSSFILAGQNCKKTQAGSVVAHLDVFIEEHRLMYANQGNQMGRQNLRRCNTSFNLWDTKLGSTCYGSTN